MTFFKKCHIVNDKRQNVFIKECAESKKLLSLQKIKIKFTSGSESQTLITAGFSLRK